MFATLRAPRLGKSGRTGGVAYLTLTVHAPLTASGVVNEQVVPVEVNGAPNKPDTVSAVIDTGAVPVLVTVTTLVTAARGAGIVNVKIVPAGFKIPLVAEVMLRCPTPPPPPVGGLLPNSIAPGSKASDVPGSGLALP